jgi:polysaccharide biosynthesis/export protein
MDACTQLNAGSETMNPRRIRNKSLAFLLLSFCLSVGAFAQATSEKAQSASTNKQPASNVTQGAPHDESYQVGATDVLAINVWKEPDVSRTVTVRSDGKISLPLVGELQANGLTPRQLEQEITKKLSNYISDPEVTVIVQESKSQRVNIMGQVAKPGSYFLTNSMTVLDAIAMAGGFRDFAKQKSIYVLRQGPNGTQTKLPFNYKDVIKGKNLAQNIKLEPGDTVVVP